MGAADLLTDEGPRRPGSAPDDPDTQAFLASDLPPLQSGHYLLRRRATSADRTWIDVNDAMRWLREQYAKHPPVRREDGPRAYVDLRSRIETTRDGLLNGVDAIWWYYTLGYNVAISAVICCPHSHRTEIPCPLPPS